MSEPWELSRPEGMPSELAIDAFAAGEADAAERSAIETWRAKDPEFSATVDARIAGYAALPMANPQAMFARIQQQLDANDASEAKAAAAHRPPSRRPRWLSWLKIGGPMLLGAAAALTLYIQQPEPARSSAQRPAGSPVTAKGSLQLKVVRQRGETIQSVMSGDVFQSGDRVRFAPDRAVAPGFMLVVGVESNGSMYSLASGPGGAALPTSTLDDDGFLPNSALLDDSKGGEWAHLVWCAHGFALTDLQRPSVGRLRGPTGCRVADFKVEKR